MSKAILLNTGWTFTKEGHDEPVTLPQLSRRFGVPVTTILSGWR